MKRGFKTVAIIVSFVLLIVVLSLAFVACDKKDAVSPVDYAKQNTYDVTTETMSIVPSEGSAELTAKVYSPTGAEARFGLLFFVGTVIPPEYYDYLGEALAKQGYVVAIPSVPFAYFGYDSQSRPAADAILTRFNGIQFFVGGHSQGGGSAMRFACEEIENVQGAIFLAPLTFGARESSQEEYDKWNESHPEWFNQNSDGTIDRADTLKNTTLPTLLLEADGDKILSPSDKKDALSKMPEKMQHQVLENACHMGFSTAEMTLAGDGEGLSDEDKQNQRLLTVSYVLDFLQITVCGQK